VKLALLLPVWDDPTLPGLARDLAATLPGEEDVLVVARARDRSQPRRLRDGRLDVRLIGWTAPSCLRPLETPVNAVLVPLALARLLDREAPDAVHYHFSGNDAWLFVALAAPSIEAPLFVTVHNVLRGFPGRPLMRRLCGRVLSRARAVSAVSEAVRASVAADFPEAAAKTSVIPNGIDVSFFAGADAPRPHPRRYALTLSRSAPAKGLDILLLAFAEAAASRPDVDLLVCGAEDDDGQTRAFARSLRLGERVRWLGVRSRGEIAALLNHCELLALGSRMEGLPLAALEAMAAGAPVLATRAGGTAECLTDGETALLVPPKDPGALAGALGRLLDDAALRARLSDAGRRAVRRFDRAAMGRAYARWFDGEAPQVETTGAAAA
jgi:glycosyltransferase involved in cell wall biosynthesis